MVQKTKWKRIPIEYSQISEYFPENEIIEKIDEYKVDREKINNKIQHLIEQNMKINKLIDILLYFLQSHSDYIKKHTKCF